MTWLGIIVASLVLVTLLITVLVWRHSWGQRELRLRDLAPIVLTTLVVYTDWGFTLFLASMLAIGAWPLA